MKIKRFRKLVLGRETLRQLEGQEAILAQGGAVAPVKTEWTICATNCENCNWVTQRVTCSVGC
jgi:hypothetical protein